MREHPNTIKAALYYRDDYGKQRADRVRKALDALEARPDAEGAELQELERAVSCAVSDSMQHTGCH